MVSTSLLLTLHKEVLGFRQTSTQAALGVAGDISFHHPGSLALCGVLGKCVHCQALGRGEGGGDTQRRGDTNLSLTLLFLPGQVQSFDFLLTK